MFTVLSIGVSEGVRVKHEAMRLSVDCPSEYVSGMGILMAARQTK